jgi:competence ComEA-like helix-hairpin-helix protein
MLNYGKVVVAVLMAIFIGMVCIISVNAGDAKQININTASAEELTQLKGVGASYAVRIIEFREKNGPFKKPEDLTLVPRTRHRKKIRRSRLRSAACRPGG